jgi:hypothetical protein
MLIWTCKIGELGAGSDSLEAKLRPAVERAYREATGRSNEFCFSHSGGALTERELALVEDRDPDQTAVAEEQIKEALFLLKIPVVQDLLQLQPGSEEEKQIFLDVPVTAWKALAAALAPFRAALNFYKRRG